MLEIALPSLTALPPRACQGLATQHRLAIWYRPVKLIVPIPHIASRIFNALSSSTCFAFAAVERTAVAPFVRSSFFGGCNGISPMLQYVAKALQRALGKPVRFKCRYVVEKDPHCWDLMKAMSADAQAYAGLRHTYPC